MICCWITNKELIYCWISNELIYCSINQIKPNQVQILNKTVQGSLWDTALGKDRKPSLLSTELFVYNMHLCIICIPRVRPWNSEKKNPATYIICTGFSRWEVSDHTAAVVSCCSPGFIQECCTVLGRMYVYVET